MEGYHEQEGNVKEGMQVKKRQLGTTGIKVSEIGFGAWKLGNGTDWSEMSD